MLLMHLVLPPLLLSLDWHPNEGANIFQAQGIFGVRMSVLMMNWYLHDSLLAPALV